MGQDISQLTEIGAFRQVLERCTWQQRFKLLSLNRSFRAPLYEQETWQIFCEWLEIQDFVHVQKRKDESWKDTFFRHYALRKRWHAAIPHAAVQSAEGVDESIGRANANAGVDNDNGGDDAESNAAADCFSISVCARFRPLPKHLEEAEKKKKDSKEDQPGATHENNECSSNSDDSDNNGEEEQDEGKEKEDKERGPHAVRIVIPLHQRIRMIQAQYNCGPSEARKLLWAGKGNVPARDPWETAKARAPPRRGPLKDLNADGPGTTTNTATASHGSPNSAPAASEGKKNNGMATPAGSDATSEEVPATTAAAHHEDVGGALPSAVRTGVLAVRPDTRDLVLCASGGLRHFEFDAVLPDMCDQEHLYEKAARVQVGEFLNGINACVLCYGQTGSGKTYSMFGPDDLASTQVTRLSPQAGIAPRAVTEVVNTVLRRRNHGLDVSLKMSVVEIFGQDIMDLLHERTVVGAWHGVAARAVLNNEAAEEIVNPLELDGMLLRAEKAKRRAATAMNERSSRAHTLLLLSLDQKNHKTGTRLHSTLCLADLGGSEQLKKSKAEGERKKEASKINLGLLALKQCISALNSKDSSHVPFGDSTLTMLLRPALSGNSFTTVVVTGSMEPRHTFETLQTMRFGEACQAVTGSEVTANVNLATRAIDVINKEITELEERIRREERWVNKTTVRKDMEGEETVVTSVLVGADELRERYEQLLETRRDLLGV